MDSSYSVSSMPSFDSTMNNPSEFISGSALCYAEGFQCRESCLLLTIFLPCFSLFSRSQYSRCYLSHHVCSERWSRYSTTYD